MQTFSMDCIISKFKQTLIIDWNKAISEDFLEEITAILGNPTLTIFNSYVSEKLEILKKEYSGNQYVKLFLEYAIFSVQNDEMKSCDLDEIICNTLKDRAMRGLRQIKEHYLLESKRSDALKVINRIKRCIELLNFSDLANEILQPSTRRSSASKKQTGLDDGVPLS